MKVKPGYWQSDVGIIPTGWDCVPISSVARLESGHTPSKREPKYWGGTIPWVSLHDTQNLEGREIQNTEYMITEKGLKNSSARLLPKGTVVFSRTATVGKCTVLGREMSTSQDFANYICGPKLDNSYLVFLFRSMGKSWKRLMAGSIHNTIYMPVFKALKIALPPLKEQRAISKALSDVDTLIASLDKLIAKKHAIKTAAMQQLLTGKKRLPGFSGDWEIMPMHALGQAYGGLTGKTKGDFGHGSAWYIPFMNVMTGPVIDPNWFESVHLAPMENQNQARKGDLFFNGSSETPEEVGFCSLLQDDIYNLYLNSFCFGFRFNPNSQANGLFFAYWFRSCEGRKAMSILAQGATRYNITKSAFMKLEIPQPSKGEQDAIAKVLSDMDAEITALKKHRDKTKAIKQGMMQELLTGRTRLI